MRYLLLSVLVVSLVGVLMVFNAFADHRPYSPYPIIGSVDHAQGKSDEITLPDMSVNCTEICTSRIVEYAVFAYDDGSHYIHDVAKAKGKGWAWVMFGDGTQLAGGCSPHSGSNFPVGTTTVICTATNAAGNSAEDIFTITVEYVPVPSVGLLKQGEIIHKMVPYPKQSGPIAPYTLTDVYFHFWTIQQGNGNFKVITLSGTAYPVEKVIARGEYAAVNLSSYQLHIEEVEGKPSHIHSADILIEPGKEHQMGSGSQENQIFWYWDDYLSPVHFTILYKVHSNVGKSSSIDLYHDIRNPYYLANYLHSEKVGELHQLNYKSTTSGSLGGTQQQTQQQTQQTQQTQQQTQQTQQQSKGGGCLIATAAFGSEMAPQVQFLRELRDNTVLQTESGTSFMAGFNQFYYSFSPAVADYERENPAFKEAVKITLTPLLTSLTLLQYADIDSESEMLGYGIGIILLNIGMYFVAPAVLIMKIRKRI